MTTAALTTVYRQIDEPTKAAVEHASRGEMREALIMTGTNDARRQINAGVRLALDLKDERQIQTLARIDATRAQRRDLGSYSEGDIIRPEQASDQLKKGAMYRVVGHAHGRLHVEQIEPTQASPSPSPSLKPLTPIAGAA